jgi:uncharacterized membrane protein
VWCLRCSRGNWRLRADNYRRPALIAVVLTFLLRCPMHDYHVGVTLACMVANVPRCMLLGGVLGLLSAGILGLRSEARNKRKKT